MGHKSQRVNLMDQTKGHSSPPSCTHCGQIDADEKPTSKYEQVPTLARSPLSSLWSVLFRNHHIPWAFLISQGRFHTQCSKTSNINKRIFIHSLPDQMSLAGTFFHSPFTSLTIYHRVRDYLYPISTGQSIFR